MDIGNPSQTGYQTGTQFFLAVPVAVCVWPKMLLFLSPVIQAMKCQWTTGLTVGNNLQTLDKTKTRMNFAGSRNFPWRRSTDQVLPRPPPSPPTGTI
ncbi:hypothetical protein NC652_018125 [Populus alba x Populus x berolinensis]|nr:hypothetical protein NC652_018125 [Populus alba x Populus x berolinensis]